MAKLIFDIFRKNLVLWILKYQKTCIWDVFRAWDYARTISRSKMLHIACPKTDIGPPKYIFGIFMFLSVCYMYSMYVFYVCSLYMYVLGTCTLCMYSMYSMHVCSPWMDGTDGASSELLFWSHFDLILIRE